MSMSEVVGPLPKRDLSMMHKCLADLPKISKELGSEDPTSLPFEELYRAFVCLRLLTGSERAQVAAFAGSWIFLARVQPVFTRFQLANHSSPANIDVERDWFSFN